MQALHYMTINLQDFVLKMLLNIITEHKMQ